MPKLKQTALSPTDFYVLLWFVYTPRPADGSPWTYQALSFQMGLSTSKVFAAVAQLKLSGLLVGKGLNLGFNRQAVANFIIHGARYAFPAERGPITRGVVTGVESEAFDAGSLVLGMEKDVWPSALGNDRGHGVAPLCEAAIEASHANPALAEALVTFDVLRLGMARERAQAELFFKRLAEPPAESTV